ncbi:spore coat protein [Bacillus massilinigeriensis]|uniref:spore coat protein n=1 Tax=Bacillus massilionigeriensis TaxID=1805475 RepID=UPI00096B2DF0|nr:spore coat protein [Bacillus massilionigeriensis]
MSDKYKHSDKPRQETKNDTDVSQKEIQGLFIRNSHTVSVTQTEVQGLLLIQAALQAAVEAAILVFGNDNHKDVQQLQKISQSLDVHQFQSQTTVIEDSGEITVLQTEVQVDVVVQAAINLLAQLLLKIG